MSKTSAALAKHDEAGLLYISVLTDPRTDGVTVSFVILGDIIISELKTLISFAGRRVVEQTINQKLPSDFQTSELLFKHGYRYNNRKNLKIRRKIFFFTSAMVLLYKHFFSCHNKRCPVIFIL